MIINYSDEKVIYSENSIFLAGPTLRGSSFEKSWRKYACSYLEKSGFNGIVYVPEPKSGNSEYILDFQFKWEREALMNSTVILFNLCRKFPELPGFTTNVEFGTYTSKKPNRCIVCSPEGAKKNEYLELLYLEENSDGVIYRNLEEALDAAIRATMLC